MPSKLRKAIGVVKDKTSIGLAKVSGTSGSNIEVIILKATRHDEAPVKERYVKELLSLISSDRSNASSCARAIGKRIGKTKTWIVALKSLILVLRIFQEGDLHFAKEVLHTPKRRDRILDLSNFRDDSSSSPWDYTAFVRTFALYLDERLDCFLTGKLQKRFNRSGKEDCIRSGKELTVFDPSNSLDKFSSWQKLLDRAIATTPTGAAKTHKLIHVSLQAIVHETFDLYRNISDGLGLLLDSFFSLQYQCCVDAYHVCVKAARQFEELSSFYDLCRSIGVGRLSEYPSIHRIPNELLETLKSFLKDQTVFTANGKSPPRLLIPSTRNRDGASDQSPGISSYTTSLGDLINAKENYDEETGRGSNEDESVSSVDSGSPTSFYLDQGTISISNSAMDLWSLEELQEQDQRENEDKTESNGWVQILSEAAFQNFGQEFDSLESSLSIVPVSKIENESSLPASGVHYNPFLEDSGSFHAKPAEMNLVKEAFGAAPTFSVHNYAQTDLSDDLFAPQPNNTTAVLSDGLSSLQQEQLNWLQNQDKIISKQKGMFPFCLEGKLQD